MYLYLTVWFFSSFLWLNLLLEPDKGLGDWNSFRNKVGVWECLSLRRPCEVLLNFIFSQWHVTELMDIIQTSSHLGRGSISVSCKLAATWGHGSGSLVLLLLYFQGRLARIVSGRSHKPTQEELDFWSARVNVWVLSHSVVSHSLWAHGL